MDNYNGDQFSVDMGTYPQYSDMHALSVGHESSTQRIPPGHMTQHQMTQRQIPTMQATNNTMPARLHAPALPVNATSVPPTLPAPTGNPPAHDCSCIQFRISQDVLMFMMFIIVVCVCLIVDSFRYLRREIQDLRKQISRP